MSFTARYSMRIPSASPKARASVLLISAEPTIEATVKGPLDMSNKEIAQIFEDMGALLQIKGENPFKIRAYQNAVRVIEDMGQPLQEFYERDELKIN